ncbi:MAG: UDP-N-acetylglucosamine 2-epimerase [Chloroflexota bacterium]|nr:UDP-N-acetylglucosamine 2-epimerase [Chloroflexota bacterium]
MRTVAVVTAGRSDYSIYRPILNKITQDADLGLFLIATGTHLSHEFGMTVEVIESDGFAISSKVDMLLSSDTPASISKSIGIGTIGFSQLYSDNTDIDLILVLGDRFEMLSAVISALPFNIPIAHIHGGESTFGLIDESIRHSISKMSHVHFTSNEEYTNRLIQMGEEPWRILTTGAPALDNLHEISLYDQEKLSEEIGFNLSTPFLLATFHPVTLEYKDTEEHITALLSALERIQSNVIFTYPNPDTSSRRIIDAIDHYTSKNTNSKCLINLGVEKYFSLMAYSSAMVGNSSSGIIEAASFGLPVVNIGDRQSGRVHGENVINAPCSDIAIEAAIQKAIDPRFRLRIKDMANPYGNGSASEHIVSHIKSLDLSQNLMMKKFHTVDI